MAPWRMQQPLFTSLIPRANRCSPQLAACRRTRRPQRSALQSAASQLNAVCLAKLEPPSPAPSGSAVPRARRLARCVEAPSTAPPGRRCSLFDLSTTGAEFTLGLPSPISARAADASVRARRGGSRGWGCGDASRGLSTGRTTAPTLGPDRCARLCRSLLMRSHPSAGESTSPLSRRRQVQPPRRRRSRAVDRQLDSR
eukprot:354195-Chlamydomonas_euryale.AAC.7